MESFGKFLFIIFDLLCGFLILKINELNMADKDKNLYSILFWFYNPITIAIASRGNAESLMSFLVLNFIYFLKRKNYILSGLFYGLAIHFKIYPVTYALALVLYIIQFKKLIENKTLISILKSVMFNGGLLKFGLSSAAILCILTYYFYLKYGYIFLYETYLYHLIRKDIRHNFSPYFYMLYLTDTIELGLIKFFSFLPQLMLILSASYYLHDKIELCLFFITFTFVTFNKVCTSQYFVWYLSLIPLIGPSLNLKLYQVILCFFTWIIGQVKFYIFLNIRNLKDFVF